MPAAPWEMDYLSDERKGAAFGGTLQNCRIWSPFYADSDVLFLSPAKLFFGGRLPCCGHSVLCLGQTKETFLWGTSTDKEVAVVLHRGQTAFMEPQPPTTNTPEN